MSEVTILSTRLEQLAIEMQRLSMAVEINNKEQQATREEQQKLRKHLEKVDTELDGVRLWRAEFTGAERMKKEIMQEERQQDGQGANGGGATWTAAFKDPKTVRLAIVCATIVAVVWGLILGRQYLLEALREAAK
jgi:hypothetical protein